MPISNLKVVWLESLSQIDRRDWDALAEPLRTPFLEWDWLRLLEVSGCAIPSAGWIPRYLTLWSGRDLSAAAPLYIKRHSEGEFVFDHVWADVAARLGRAYYPKLVGMSPFTPMIGYRFLVAPGIDELDMTERMLAETDRFCRRNGLAGSSFHFVDPSWGEILSRHGYRAWIHQSFAWKNEGYRSFEDYLAGFNSNQRRHIRRERRELSDRGIRFEMIPGADLPRKFYTSMYAFYARTNDQFGPWGCKYLTPEFFTGLAEHFPQRLLFAAAFDGERCNAPVAMSLLVTKADQLYGRYWGCRREIEFLHFAACYYQPIEWAIRQGIQAFDPGMGGSHKVRRGFKAVPNYSLHRLLDPILRQIMERNMDAINRLELANIDALNQELPLRRV
jgi:hypothetical protein